MKTPHIILYLKYTQQLMFNNNWFRIILEHFE